MGVPFMDYKDERPALQSWAGEMGESGLAFHTQKNTTQSLDGHETDIFEKAIACCPFEGQS